MLSPNELDDALRREREILSGLHCDVYSLYDRVTVVLMTVAILRRYAAENRDVLDSSVQVQVGSTLQVAEREMPWLATCGGDADEIDLLAAVSSSLKSAEQAAALLRSDISGVVIAPMEIESRIRSTTVLAAGPG